MSICRGLGVWALETIILKTVCEDEGFGHPLHTIQEACGPTALYVLSFDARSSSNSVVLLAQQHLSFLWHFLY